MGRIYVANFKAITVTAAQDLFEIAAPSDAIVRIHEWTLTQTTEVGDTEEEMLQLTTNRGVGATSGSGGASVTPQPIEDGDAAFGGTVERNNTTQMSAGGGSIEELEAHNWNVRIPYQRIYTPETRPIISPSQHWTLELETAPDDSITMSGTIIFEEIGG